MALENAHFSFFQFLVSQFLEGFGEKTYEKTCRFYNTFSKSSSICSHLRSFRIWIFFSKISWPNLMSIFFTFHRFYEKTYVKTYQFYGLFPNVLSLCARSQNFVIWKFFLKKCQLFQYFNNLWFICWIWSNICDKVYEKTYHFFLHISKLWLYFHKFAKFHH